jgi:hypothetical protein
MLFPAFLRPKVFGLLVILEFIICSPALFSQTGQVFDLVGGPIYGPSPNIAFGLDIKLSANGERIAISSPNDTTINGPRSGSVRVYELTPTGWSQLGNDIIGLDTLEAWGVPIALSGDGNRVALSAAFSSGGNGFRAGETMVFEWNGDEWQKLGQTIVGASEGDESGSFLSLSPDGSLLTLSTKSDGNTERELKTLQWQDSLWIDLQIDFSQILPDVFSETFSVSSDGSWLALGLPNDNRQTGQVQIYRKESNAWTQVGKQILGENTGDGFGITPIISEAGNYVLIQAERRLSAERAGKVYAYERIDSNWVLKGTPLSGQFEQENYGRRIDMSGNGNRIAIGRSFEDFLDEPNYGKLDLFQFVERDWIPLGEAFQGSFFKQRIGSTFSLSGDGSKIAFRVSGRDPADSSFIEIVEVYTINPGFARISGTFLTLDDRPLEGVQTGLEPSFSGTQITDSTGVFLVSVLDDEDDRTVTIRPTKVDTSAEGLTTLDLLAVAQHILGRKPLSSPCQLLAADVNRDGSITVTDLLAMYNWILGNPPEDAQTRSWRFVVADHSFDNPRNPLQEAYPNQLVVPLTEVKRGLRFIAIKPGDVVH